MIKVTSKGFISLFRSREGFDMLPKNIFNTAIENFVRILDIGDIGVKEAFKKCLLIVYHLIVGIFLKYNFLLVHICH